MKFFTDLLQIHGKFSLSRILLIIMFFAILAAWITGIAEVTGGMITIFSLLLGYVFGDKVAKTAESLSLKKLETTIIE